MLVILFAARSSLADHYHVPTGSMEHTIMIGDRVLIDKTAFGLRVPFTPIEITEGGGPPIAALTIPDGYLLALGDHRGNSFDSRYFGLVAADDIYGRALGVYYRRGEGLTWLAL